MSKTASAAGKTWEGKGKAYALRELDVSRDVGDHSSLVRSLLVSRGIQTQDEADAFLNPDFSAHVHDPFLMKGMEEAVERIRKAMRDGEKIAVYSDYDADGIPGGVILHDLFKKIGYEHVVNYIPHRHDEGFGLNLDAVEKLASEGVKLLITVDCGITDIAEVGRARELGVDVIITDHHLPSAHGLPPAFAVIDPKQEGCGYPFKELCGSGVAWKLSCALLMRDRFGAKDGWEKWLLDMAGLATLSDMVPLVGENRVLAFFGLKVLRKTPRLGLLKLARRLKLDLKTITEDDIGFTITPRINAASRMGVPMDAFKLLATSDEAEADTLADHLDSINAERKTVVATMVREVKKHFAEVHGKGEMKRVIVAGNPDWRPSLLGLVANSLVEEYDRPVFLWGREGGDVLKGSCRSDGSVNVVELMERANRSASVFVDFGGHKMSGGFSAGVDTVHLIEDALVAACESALKKAEQVAVDAALGIDDVNWDTYRQIEKLAPFGLANPKPLFAIEKVAIDDVSTFGKGDLHMKVAFRNGAGKKMSAIAFFTKPSDFSREVSAGDTATLIAHLECSNFRNFPELRLRIVDVC